MTNLVTKEKVLLQFGISQATLRNWVKNAIPQARIATSQPKGVNNSIQWMYDLAIVENYVREQAKLQQRANKKRSKGWRPPTSLLAYLTTSTAWISGWMDYVQDHEDASDKLIAMLRAHVSGKKTPKSLITTAVATIPTPDVDLYAFAVAYQGCLNDGQRSQQGSYFSPLKMVKDLVENSFIQNGNFLEPCCGSGFIVLEYLKAHQQKYQGYPAKVYINDVDQKAVQICALLCQELTGGKTCVVATTMDGTKLPYRQQMDTVASNPPYGIKQKFEHIKTTEIFSQMLYMACGKYAKSSGVVRFVLPHSILNVAKHQEIRSYVATNHTIQAITDYAQAFDGVTSHIITLSILCQPIDKQEFTFYQSNNIKTMVGFSSSTPKTWTAVSQQEEGWLKAIYAVNHLTLKDADFALGIVTGNNKAMVYSKKPKNGEVVLSGKNIGVGEINSTPKFFIKKADYASYQQKPPKQIFKGKKIVYRFISKNLVTAVDDTDAKTLNSANIIKLKQTKVSVEYVSAILNSAVANRIYQLKFGNPLKVLKSALQELPIFLFTPTLRKTIKENYKKGQHAANETLIKKTINQLLSQKN